MQGDKKAELVYVGFNLPKKLHNFVKTQMKKTYKGPTEYFKDLILNEKIRIEQNKEK